MNNYSEILDTNFSVKLELNLELIGQPEYVLSINNKNYHSIMVCAQINILDAIDIEIVLKNKIYSVNSETAVHVKELRIENELIIPKYSHLVKYTNDHNFTDPTNYIGFNGIWRLKIAPNFFHWLHKVKGYGWNLGDK